MKYVYALYLERFMLVHFFKVYFTWQNYLHVCIICHFNIFFNPKKKYIKIINDLDYENPLSFFFMYCKMFLRTWATIYFYLCTVGNEIIWWSFIIFRIFYYKVCAIKCMLLIFFFFLFLFYIIYLKRYLHQIFICFQNIRQH